MKGYTNIIVEARVNGNVRQVYRLTDERTNVRMAG